MAEGNSDEENPYSFRNYNRKKETNSNEDIDIGDNYITRPDLGIGNQHDSEKRAVPDMSSSVSDVPRREENPFSFKHFLKRESNSNYQNTGARPKVYNSVSSDNSDHLDLDVEMETGLFGRSGASRHVGSSELTSVLPDFVQDHLVVEQCYLNHSDSTSSQQLTVDLENLPDFAINNVSPAQESCNLNNSNSNLRHWEESACEENDNTPKDIPFDLTSGSTRSQHYPGRVRKNSGPVPLDLPVVESDQVSPTGRQNGGLPFDLPLVHDVDVAQTSSLTPSSRSGPSLGEVGVSKSLPDFLSDGPIHSGRHNDEALDPIVNCINNGSRPTSDDVHRLQMENDRLRRELDILRRQSSEQARRIQFLENKVCTMHSKEHEETASLEKAIEQVEDNLKRSTRRAVLAENQVSKLKQETKILLNELTQLRRENHELRTGQGLSSTVEQNHEVLTQKLSHDLRAAASTAEVSLRQLLTGVENLRVIAATMESMHRIHDRTSDFLAYDEDDDDDASASASAGAGPAL